MLKVRVIPALLLKGRGLVKTIKFGSATYIGDPINAVRIFNDKEVDELVFLDIEASKLGKEPNYSLLRDITDECFMPLAYGGGVKTLDQIQELLKIGVEKIIINTAAHENPKFVREAVRMFGSSTMVVSMDVKRNFWGRQSVYVKSGTLDTKRDPVAYARAMEDLGAGEILLNSIDADGTMKGYDLATIKSISAQAAIPLVACGGAKDLTDFKSAKEAGASAVAAGSMFVFKGPNRAVLISYPAIEDLEAVLG